MVEHRGSDATRHRYATVCNVVGCPHLAVRKGHCQATLDRAARLVAQAFRLVDVARLEAAAGDVAA